MIFRLKALYLRYAAVHADRLGGFSLPKVVGKTSGQVEMVTRTRGLTKVIGWTTAQDLRIDWPDGFVTGTPGISRPDVTRRFNLPVDTGFEFELPESARPLSLTATWANGKSAKVNVPHPSEPPSPAAHRRLRRLFARQLLRAVPDLIRWAITKDPAARHRAKSTLGLDGLHPAGTLDPRYFAKPTRAQALHGFTIILPVYNAFDDVTECLERVVRHTDLDWHMILIDDASTDGRVRPHLQAFAAQHPDRVTLVLLDENHGFVGAVNRGLALAEGRAGHVVLLNSDAMVPSGWASRLLAPLEADPSIASVTPMSNDAEIFSVPVMGERLDLPTGLADRMDAAAQKLSMPMRLPSAPTGVGFCMALHSKWLTSVPRFDTAFGRGYGEEVDWCQKIRARGGRHVCLPSLFVEHRGGQSFGAEAKRDLVFKANTMIARRYPRYDLDVQGFIGRDPLRTPRLALAVAMAAEVSRGSVPLYVAHAMGGGADQALMAEIDVMTEAGQFALVLRVGGAERWQLEVHGPTGVVAGTIGDLASVRRLLAPVCALSVIYSCGVGDGDPVELPAAMLSLARSGAHVTFEARVHDFFMISPSYCLLDSAGRFNGPVTTATRDHAHTATRPDGRVVPLREWQAAWHTFLAACSEITVFSEPSRDVLLASYPDLTGKIVTRPHSLTVPVGVVPKPSPDAPRVVAVLGNINLQKGARVLCDLAKTAQGQVGAPKFVLIGNIDPSFTLPSGVRLHGTYQRSEIAHLADRYGVTDWLIPSIWPETFSYATHEALATGLPVYAFDIGAQGDAVRHSVNGVPIPFDADACHAGAILAALDGDLPGTKPMIPAFGLEAAE